MDLIMPTLVAALTWGGERLLEAGFDTVKSRLRNRAATAELAEITERALEAAIRLTPSLREDFRSASFIQGVVSPAVLESLTDVSASLDTSALADEYIRRFVTPWVADGDEDNTLAKMFETDRNGLAASLSAFAEELRRGLMSSKHWKEVARDRAIEEIRAGVSDLLVAQPRARISHPIDLDMARADSRIASQDLLEWRRTISGLFIDRPELDLLVRRIQTEPRGRTLLVGEAGSGKSALLSEMTERLHREGMTVFAVKADMLPADIANTGDLSRALGLQGDLESELNLLAAAGPVVLVIDQMDAVSSVMDRSSQRMKLLLRIANSFVHDRRYEDGPPVHVLVSSRPFEASHDGRFQSLRAETVKLGLPAYEKVLNLLGELNIDASAVPETMRETLRRPFALRLFVDLVGRGVDVREIKAVELLDAWLVSADLGAPQIRPRVIEFLEHLAQTMTETETLWRPADALDLAWFDAVSVAEASGLILRQDGRIGFSHQSWFDDFQAKAFQDGPALAQFAWDRQDGLFARATVLRGLERLRRRDLVAYEAALDLLLGDQTTRRHLRHLTVDLVSGQEAPTPRETAWIRRLFVEDVPLTRRAVGKIAERWPAWRDALLPAVPSIMANPALRWAAVRLIGVEALVDPDAAVSLLRSEWDHPDKEVDLFEALWRAKVWTPWVAGRIGTILERNTIADFAIGHYIEDLADTDRVEAGIALLTLYLRNKTLPARRKLKLNGLEKIVGAAPLALAEALTPWFIELVGEHSEPNGQVYDEFPRARTLPHDWEVGADEDDIYTAFRASLASAAKSCPEEAMALIKDLSAVEVDEAQALVADTFATNPSRFAQEALVFLTADARRLNLGSARFDDEEGVGHTIQGWSSLELIAATAPFLTSDDHQTLKAAIERWEPYRDLTKGHPKTRMMRRGWVREAHFKLFERLPAEAFSSRERRQVREWRARQPKLRGKGRVMAHTVGAPMSVEQMAKATDAQLLGLLDDCRDGTGWSEGHRSGKRRHISRSGGVVQVSRSFAALAKTQPDRVLRLVRERLLPERHQSAAGAAVNELSSHKAVDAEALVALIHRLHAKGFTSEDWRRDAAWAFQNLARRLNGLEPADLSLIESWIVDDDAVVRRCIERRLESEATKAERRPEPDRPEPASAVVFGRGLGGGFNVLPQDNYTYLSALADGVLNRAPPNPDAWLEVLERHAQRHEDPQVWEAVLAYHGQALFWADRERTKQLFATLWDRFPDAFTPTVGGILWGYHAMIPTDVLPSILRHWIAEGDMRKAQAAGEIAVAAKLVSGDDDPLAAIADELIAGPASPGQTGAVFASAAAWRENAGGIRLPAHDLLLRFGSGADGHLAEAVSTALDAERTLSPDASTEALLRLALDNPPILKAALNGRFADALQSLLLYPGFEDTVLIVTEHCVDEIVDRDGSRGFDDDFVAITIALQRGPDAQRARAMTLYERLLDADAYGADRAATAALRN
jgi:hypothetical protein